MTEKKTTKSRGRGFGFKEGVLNKDLDSLGLSAGLRTLPDPAPGVQAQAPAAPEEQQMPQEPVVPAAAAPAVEAVAAVEQAPARRVRKPKLDVATMNLELPIEVWQKVAARRSDLQAKGKRVSLLTLGLEAITNQQEKLAVEWRQDSSEQELADGELFAGLTAKLSDDSASRNVATKSIQLTGLKPNLVARLEQLVSEWEAPSRRALFIRAFEMEYPNGKRKGGRK